jgi:hypothetical protein
MRIVFLTLLVFCNISHSQPPEKKDKFGELMMSRFCHYAPLNENDVKQLINDSKNRDPLASYLLYFGQNMINSEAVPDNTTLLNQLVESKNPYAAMIIGFMYLDEKETQKGINWLEFAANFNIIEAIDYLIKIYEGKQYPKFKNKELASSWLKRRALIGNIFRLKAYIYENPHDLSQTELKNWKDAYKIISGGENTSSTDNLTQETKWLISIFNENKKRTMQILKKYHPWYANYKYCNK